VAILDVEQLLRPLSDDAPCGVDLEYDSAFVEMGRASQRLPDQQYGDTVIPGKEPEWIEVKSNALDVLGRSKDLRAAVLLTQAELRIDGLRGFSDALAVVKGFIEQYWEPVYPRLDPDDDNDPTLRVNSIGSLVDNGTMILPLQRTPIVRSRVAGNFSHRDIGIITGEFPRPDEDTDETIESRAKLIDAAFEDCDLAVLKSDALAAKSAADVVKQLDTALTQRVGSGSMRSLAPLAKELLAIHKILVDRLAKRGHSLTEAAAPAEEAAEVAEVAEATAPAVGGDSSANAPAATMVRQAQNWNADITCRDDAIKALERVCLYFEKYEPSSPLPLLLRRAKRLSSKSFLEILKDISPDGLGQAEALGGLERDG